MQIILGPDGTSLGGFVCPACVVHAELWKVGQLRPGDQVRFRPMTEADAVALDRAQDHAIASLSALPAPRFVDAAALPSPIVLEIPARGDTPALVCRAAGDRYLLIECGPLVLDLELRFRIHALMRWLEQRAVAGVIDLTPGIRSLQVHYDSRILPRASL